MPEPASVPVVAADLPVPDPVESPIVSLEAEASPPRRRRQRRSPTAQESERAAQRRLEELHAIGMRIFHRLEGLFEEEAELEPETWPYVLRLVARSVELRTRGGEHNPRHDGPAGRPEPRFQKAKGPPDPARRAVVYRCMLGRNVESHAAEG